MDEVKIAIIGSGVIGLAVALEAGSSDVFVLEKNHSFGLETSSRNSGVLHAGIYYTPGSLKARLCVEGQKLIYDFCRKHNIACRELGKIIVAQNEEEVALMHQLYQRAQANGVEGLRIISRAELKDLEPNVEGIAGLFSPTTGIVDIHFLMQAFYRGAKSLGTNFVFRCEVLLIEKITDGFRIFIRENGKVSEFFARAVINCAGLAAEKMAGFAGIDTKQAGYTTYFLKGDYFSIQPKKWGLVKRLIYPVPQKHGLGIHNCIFLDGRELLGPNEYYVDAVDYAVKSSRAEFYESANPYFPFLDIGDLTPDFSGIRPVLVGPSERAGNNDFIISHETEKGFPGLVNLVAINSPGLTACLAIARYVRKIVEEFLD